MSAWVALWELASHILCDKFYHCVNLSETMGTGGRLLALSPARERDERGREERERERVNRSCHALIFTLPSILLTSGPVSWVIANGSSVRRVKRVRRVLLLLQHGVHLRHSLCVYHRVDRSLKTCLDLLSISVKAWTMVNMWLMRRRYELLSLSSPFIKCIFMYI